MKDMFIKIEKISCLALMMLLLIGGCANTQKELASAIPPSSKTNQMITAQKQTVTQCTEPPNILNAQELFGIADIAHFNFTEGNLIEVSGWTRTVYGSPASYQPRQWTSGVFDFKNEVAKNENSGFSDVLRSPCTDCIVEVIRESPNRKWQLLTVDPTAADFTGTWLVSADQSIHLVDHVPYENIVTWSEDSNWLLYQYTQEIEFDLQLIVLSEQPTVVSSIVDNSDLDPVFNYIASSASGMILTTKSPRFGKNNELLQYFQVDPQLPLNELVPMTSQHIVNLAKPFWNDASQEFMYILKENDGFWFTNEDGNINVHLPHRTLGFSVPVDSHTLSASVHPSGERLAVHFGARLYLLECN